MLKQLRFENFKSWRSVQMDCAPITGIFGTNSSGKTSLLQFILLLKQTKDATDRAVTLELNGDLVKLGSISDVMYRHDEALALSWGVKFQLDSPLSLSDASRKRAATITTGQQLSLSVDTTIQNRTPIVNRLSYDLGDFEFSLASKTDQSPQFDLVSTSHAVVSDGGYHFVRSKGRPWSLPGPIKSYAFPDQARTYFQNASFLADLEATYEDQLDRTFYLGPLREYPQRDYLWSRSRPSDVGQRGEKVIDAILAATAADETRNLRPKAHLKSFQEMIAYWLREMGLIEDFRVEEIAPDSNRWQARVRTRRASSQVLLTDVGFGISQVLPVITLLQYVPTGSTVILEQPEIHLHPLAQSALADVIIQAALHRNVQVILESHSEHLLLRLQRRIAEQTLPSEAVKLYFCNIPDESSHLEELDLDIFGVIKNWPDRFMGDAFQETAKAELARLRRMQ